MWGSSIRFPSPAATQRAFALTLLGLLAPAAACGGGSGSQTPDAKIEPPDENGPRRMYLTHLAADILAPTYGRFATAADGLTSAIQAHCAALAGGGDGAATRTAAQAAWGTAIDLWERADAVLVGPAAMDFRTPRDRIYAWPLAATCPVDRDVAARWKDAASYDVADRSSNARSLAAVEYLLFTNSTGHTCPQDPVGWTAASANLPRARCELAGAIAADVTIQARALDTAWRADGGNYIAQLAKAGAEGSSIASEQVALNLVSDSFFYVDRLVKDMKLAEAAGISVNACGVVGQRCDLEIEHPHADRSTTAILVNLRTLREAFTGTTEAGEGPGFDDILRSVSADDVAVRMTASLDQAIAAAAAMPASYSAALDARAPVLATHAAVKAFTDDLKSQFLTVLGLDIPDDVAGDND